MADAAEQAFLNGGDYTGPNYSPPSFQAFPTLLGGITGAAGAMPTTGNSKTNSTTTSSGSQQNNINFSPQIQALLNQLSPQYARMVSQGTNLQPYQQQQEQNINNNSQLAQQASQNNLAARGLSTSPVAAAVQNTNDQNRIGQINSLQQSIPLLQRQLQSQNLQQAGQFAASVPYGTSSDASNNSTTNSTTKQSSGGGLGGFLSGIGSVLGGVGSLAAFSDKELKENIEDDKNDHLGKLLKMKPKTFNYKGSSEHSSGFIAQDVEKHFPNMVQTEPLSGLKMVKYHELIPKIIGAIHTLNENIKGMNSKNTSTHRSAA